MALFGVLFKILENQLILKHELMNNYAFRLFVVGVLLTFFLSVLWMEPNISFYIFSGIGALLQLIAFAYILQKLHKLRVMKREGISKLIGLLLKTAAVLFSFKLIAQGLGAIPKLAEIVSANKDLIISYLHWVFLGVVTISIFAYSAYNGLMKITKTGFYFFLTGFLLTEGFLIYKAFKVWSNTILDTNYYTLLFVASFILLIAIGTILFQQKRSK
jgi:hypothetical protein